MLAYTNTKKGINMSVITKDNAYTEVTIEYSPYDEHKTLLLSQYFIDKLSTNEPGDIYYYKNSFNVLYDVFNEDSDAKNKTNDPKIIFYKSLIDNIIKEKYCGTVMTIQEKSMPINNDDYQSYYNFYINYMFENSKIRFKWTVTDAKTVFIFYNAISNYAQKYYLVYLTSSNGKKMVDMDGHSIEFPRLFKVFDSYSLTTTYFVSSERKFTYYENGKQTESHGIYAYPSEKFLLSRSKWEIRSDDLCVYDECCKDYYFYILDKLFENKYIDEDELLNVKMYLNVID